MKFSTAVILFLIVQSSIVSFAKSIPTPFSSGEKYRYVAHVNTVLFKNSILIQQSPVLQKKPKNKEQKRTFTEISKSIEEVVGALATIIADFCGNDRYYKSADEYYYNQKPNGYKYDQIRPYNP